MRRPYWRGGRKVRNFDGRLKGGARERLAQGGAVAGARLAWIGVDHDVAQECGGCLGAGGLFLSDLSRIAGAREKRKEPCLSRYRARERRSRQ